MLDEVFLELSKKIIMSHVGPKSTDIKLIPCYKLFGNLVIHNISLQLSQNMILAIIGTMVFEVLIARCIYNFSL